MSVLFPVQVPRFQPAFIYDTETKSGSVNIYYSLSEFNESLENPKFEITIVDPNKSSGWGQNSMIFNSSHIIVTDCLDPARDYITLTISGTDFKQFNLNQFYQLQLTLVNGADKSVPSQTTLIRPIPSYTLQIEQLDSSVVEFNTIKGCIAYSDNSQIEAIKEYNFVLKSGGLEVYRSKNIINTLGTHFEEKIYDCNLSDGTYDIEITFITVNGHKILKSGSITIGASSEANEMDFSYAVVENINKIGGIEFTFQFGDDDFEGINNIAGYNVYIQRSSEEEYYNSFKTIKTIANKTVTSASELNSFGYKYMDLTAAANVKYKYRVIVEFPNTENKLYIYNKHNNKDIEVLSQFEDIFLLGEKQQMSIRYNPNITGVKYVTQESITNTLGGKYPIVRINGETKYQQFNLSGTLYFKATLGDEYSDSISRIDYKLDADGLFAEKEDTLLFSLSTIQENFLNFISSTKDVKERLKKYIEKKYISMAKEFLTDQKPKLLKGPAEETMIVYLSNISFTPNKTANREVIDFSCTVTELADFNFENLARFDILTKETYYKLAYYFDVDANGYILDTYEDIPVMKYDWVEVSD